MLGGMDKQTSRPCPSCGKHMQLKRVIPGLAGLPQLFVYSCQFCGVSLTEAEEPKQHRSTTSGPAAS
jgi:predicted  nucleic acid-binding Zn ribbon protein